MANVIRNVWANAVIFCGHFPDGAEKFTKTDMDGESKGQWYLRQMLGSANIDAGPVLEFMTGNLSYQIEHHLYPDLPSNRLAEISVRVRAAVREVRPALHQRAVSWCSTARRGAPSPNCRCRTGTCAPPPTTRRRPAASGCSTSCGPGDRRGLKIGDRRARAPTGRALIDKLALRSRLPDSVRRSYARSPAFSPGCSRTCRGWAPPAGLALVQRGERLDLLVAELEVEDLEVLLHPLRV